jgi:eukaryotic-like serine/threonine-protein kinase
VQWIQTYPADDTPHLDLGDNYAYMGQFDKAVAETREHLRLTPEDVIGYGNLMGFYLPLNRLDEAKAAYNDALARKLDSAYLHAANYQLAFLQGDGATMKQELTWAGGKPGAEDFLLSAQSDTEGYAGRLTKARELSQRAVDSATRNDAGETAALWQANGALREVEFGNADRGRQAAEKSLAMSQGRDVRLLAALALARVGDTAQAQSLLGKLNGEFPLDLLIQNYWIPAIRASVELDRGGPQHALEILGQAAPNDLAAPLPFQEGTMYPAYLRGQTYLKLGQGQQAAAEFQKIVDHRGLVQNFSLGALAHAGLARAHARAGDTAKARVAYQDFFALWKDADPDIPILKEAKAEYAKLQ